MDKQKNRVYAWENAVIAPKDKTEILFAQVEPLVRYIWLAEGLDYPPQVLPMPKKKTKKADATRVAVRFGDKTFTWIVVHELAHSLTSLCDGRSNHHGALFMGMYLQLLSRYLKCDFQELVESARDVGLKVKEDARPVFLEEVS